VTNSKKSQPARVVGEILSRQLPVVPFRGQPPRLVVASPPPPLHSPPPDPPKCAGGAMREGGGNGGEATTTHTMGGRGGSVEFCDPKVLLQLEQHYLDISFLFTR
jgi:hypothetical protein